LKFLEWLLVSSRAVSLSLCVVSGDIFFVILQLRDGIDLCLSEGFLVLISLYRRWRKLIRLLRVRVIHGLGLVCLSSALHLKYLWLLK
jgi:hypothetical protein